MGVAMGGLPWHLERRSAGTSRGL